MPVPNAEAVPQHVAVEVKTLAPGRVAVVFPGQKDRWILSPVSPSEKSLGSEVKCCSSEHLVRHRPGILARRPYRLRPDVEATTSIRLQPTHQDVAVRRRGDDRMGAFGDDGRHIQLLGEINVKNRAPAVAFDHGALDRFLRSVVFYPTNRQLALRQARQLRGPTVDRHRNAGIVIDRRTARQRRCRRRPVRHDRARQARCPRLPLPSCS